MLDVKGSAAELVVGTQLLEERAGSLIKLARASTNQMQLPVPDQFPEQI